MTTRFLIIWLAMCGVSACWAQGDQDLHQCFGSDDDVAACTRVIEAGGIESKILAHAYYMRGLHFQMESDLDRAISDYSKSIELDPRYPSSYYMRGHALEASGDLERAKADHSKARELGAASPE